MPAALYRSGRFLVLISVRGWVDPQDHSAAGRIVTNKCWTMAQLRWTVWVVRVADYRVVVTLLAYLVIRYSWLPATGNLLGWTHGPVSCWWMINNWQLSHRHDKQGTSVWRYGCFIDIVYYCIVPTSCIHTANLFILSVVNWSFVLLLQSIYTPRGLRHEPSSLARTLGSWVRIPLKAMDVCYVRLCCVCVVLCLGRGLATCWSLVQGVLPYV
jgi:hypothetical protein